MGQVIYQVLSKAKDIEVKLGKETENSNLI